MESAPEFRSYDAALDELTALSKEKRIVFVIDEYPYLAKAKPAISAMLQHIIDHKWTESKMYLILCGSSMSFMESQVLGKESPLYGRRTGQFKIEPLDYKETAVFHPNLSAEDNSLIYGITGEFPTILISWMCGIVWMKLCWIISLTAPAICMRNRGTY